jgi:hypothetical protein
MENPTNKWFYELPEINGQFYFKPPLDKDEFLVRVGSISIQNRSYFLVESVGKNNVYGLLAFFTNFTGKFENGSFGYSDGVIPFLVNYRFGVEYMLLEALSKKANINIQYIPATLIFQTKRLDVWYFL